MNTDEPITRAVLDEVLSDAFDKFAYKMSNEVGGLISDLANMVAVRFDEVDKRFESVDQRFDKADKRFDAMDKRFDAMDQRFDAMDARFDKADKRSGSIEGRLAHLESDIATIKERLHYIEAEIKAQRNDIKYVLDGLASANYRVSQLEAKFDRYYLLTTEDQLTVNTKVAELKAWVVAASPKLGLHMSVDS